MRFFVLMVFAVSGFMLSFGPAMAEQGVIVINPDGTITESDASKVEHKPVSKLVKEADVPDPEAAHAAAKAKTLAHEQQSVFTNEPEDVPAVKAAPKPKPTSAKATPAKTMKPKKAPAAKTVKDTEAASEAPTIKWNKPPKAGKKKKQAEIAAPTPAPAPIPAEEPQHYEPITREQALRNAIAVAPPFKRSTVLPGNYKGHPVYEVVLQTEDGEHSILIDTMTGDVVKQK